MLSFLTKQKKAAEVEAEPKEESAGLKTVGNAFRAALAKKLDKFVASDRPKTQKVSEADQQEEEIPAPPSDPAPIEEV